MTSCRRVLEPPSVDRERRRIERVVCGCGRCGVVFETVIGRGQRRLYAPGCPVRVEQQRQQNNESSKRAYARLVERNPRKCYCGCGRVAAPRLWYHPECKAAKLAAKDGDRGRCEPRANKRCGHCQGQSWRRHRELGCVRCGQPYAEEKIARREAGVGCGLGEML